tara:strand:- start:708 stop:1631 length:924 start_codon:yes stop_codon:yes gene_type:complete
MKTLMFPGQGSQSVGMGSELFKNFELVKKIFKEADEKLNYPISKIILDGPEDKLKLTKNTQPAIMIISYSIYKLITEEFGIQIKDIKYFCGHSLGEYSALVSIGSLNFQDALYLLHERGKSMQEAVPEGKGAMLAVLGLKMEEVTEYIKQVKDKGICEIANDNSDSQIILSGEKNPIEEINKILKLKKKKSIFLPVSAPFHSSLMKSAAQKMRDKILKTSFKKPSKELISNVTAEPVTDIDKIKDLLIQQIYSKVRWRESLLFMVKSGINEFIEIGPGKVLSSLAKRISGNINVKSINTVEDIKNLK